MNDKTVGGNDTLTGGRQMELQTTYFTAMPPSCLTTPGGGNDTLTGGNNGSDNILYGDAAELFDNARGGNDTLTGGNNGSYNELYGDADLGLFDNTRGGSDTLIGGNNGSDNQLYGDAYAMHTDAVGGNDTLIGGDDSTNYLYGDAERMTDNAVGGNDTLISGTGTDYMWGDGQFIIGPDVKTGTDIFVFKPNSGTDFIEDFRHSDGDRIDVSAYGYTGFSQLALSENGSDAVLDFGGGNSVTLIGVDHTTLVAADFNFA